MSYNRSVKDITRRLLYAKSGNKCAMCQETLIFDDCSNTSEICHIEAVNEDGARYNPNSTDDYINSYDNLILLCPRCHKIVDSPQNQPHYSVDYLKSLKKKHEDNINNLIEAGVAISCPIIVNNETIIKIHEKHNDLFDKDINADFIKSLCMELLSFNKFIRSVIFGIIVCCDEQSYEVDTTKLLGMVEADDYYMANAFEILLQCKYIKETAYHEEWAGYEDQEGYYHLVKNNYLFRLRQGKWFLRKRKGNVLLAIYSLLNQTENLYDFLVEQNINSI